MTYLYTVFQAEDKMERCLEDQTKQAMRWLNNTGVSSIPAPTLDSVDEKIYNELLHNASILYNETLITCNKTKFLTVRAWERAIRDSKQGMFCQLL